MSGITPWHVDQFRRALNRRDLDLGLLAEQVGCARSRLSEFLWGHLKGVNYWAKIRACVTDGEWSLLLHVENCATWNNAQLAHGPDAEVWLLRAQCAWCNGALPFVPCEKKMSGAPRVSHGLCPKCYAVEAAKIAAMRPAPRLVALVPALRATA